MRHYRIVIEKAENNFSAYSPDLPGCVATGTTREETEKNMHEAIQLHIEGMMEDNLQFLNLNHLRSLLQFNPQ
ncbi:MAG: type II toxin-antitoxin system HicB family antitoxin [Ignavibacteriae bacterium]|nr:type II toxin-antitoxin system HicB family antitoxin [Ignavibacteriota bacterium]